MPTRSHAKRAALLLSVGVALGALALAPPWVAAARVLAGTLGGGASPLPPLLGRPPHAVIEQDESIAGLRSRRYVPQTSPDSGRHALLLHGAHPRGIDEPRLRRMARALSAEGIAVHTVELPSLRALRLDGATVQQITAAVAATSRRAGGQRVAAYGISVTGGFLLQAALDPRAARALACVVTVGAHHDLRTVARAYAARARASGPSALDPYGARVLVSAYADALLEPDDVEPAREAIRLYVSERYAPARAALARLSPRGRALVAPLFDRPREAIPPLMATLLALRGDSLAALSPTGKLGDLRVPAFLLHGEQDPVVPSSETRALSAEVPDAYRAHVLVTPLLRHAEGSRAPDWRDALRLVDFMADALATAERRADP